MGNSQKLKQNLNLLLSFQNNYGLASLEIANVTKDDAGLYSVRATNTEGEVACSASLDVSGWNILLFQTLLSQYVDTVM